MKALRSVNITVLTVAICLCFSGCYTPAKNTRVRFQESRARFQESSLADVVLQFYRWDTFFIIRPDYRDNSFLRPLNERSLNNALDALNVRHDMAVVVIVWTYQPEEMVQIAEGWRTVLGKRGFKRVVCLSGDDKHNLDGLPVIDDWRQSAERPKRTAQLQAVGLLPELYSSREGGNTPSSAPVISMGR